MPSLYNSAGLVASLALYTVVSAAPQQAYTITNSMGEVLTLLPTTTVGLDTGLVTLPVEPTDANGSTVFPPVSIPPVSMPTVVDTPTVSGGATSSFDVPPVPMPTVVTTGSSSSIGGGSSTAGATGPSSTASLPPPTSTAAPAAAPRATGFAGAAVGVVAAIAGLLYL